jgi:hypothetical protein
MNDAIQHSKIAYICAGAKPRSCKEYVITGLAVTT